MPLHDHRDGEDGEHALPHRAGPSRAGEQPLLRRNRERDCEDRNSDEAMDVERVERQRCRDERGHEPEQQVAQERFGGEAADRHDDADQREPEDPDQHASADPVDVLPLVRVAGHQQAVRIEVAEELGDERSDDLGQRPTEIPGFVQADEQGVRCEQVEEQEGHQEEAVRRARCPRPRATGRGSRRRGARGPAAGRADDPACTCR